MASTLLLDQTAWDLVVDARGNIAVAAEPYALAQDAASAIKTFQGECFWDTTVGVPYLSQILGRLVPLPLLKQALIKAALTVPGVVSAQIFVSALNERTLRGQVQVTSTSGATSAPTSFVAVNPQGAG
jgi:hypothetical protein